MTLDLILRGIIVLGMIVLTFTMLVYGEFNPRQPRTKKELINLSKRQNGN